MTSPAETNKAFSLHFDWLVVLTISTYVNPKLCGENVFLRSLLPTSQLSVALEKKFLQVVLARFFFKMALLLSCSLSLQSQYKP